MSAGKYFPLVKSAPPTLRDGRNMGRATSFPPFTCLVRVGKAFTSVNGGSIQYSSRPGLTFQLSVPVHVLLMGHK